MIIDFQQYAKRVLVILTGGTISKQYDQFDGTMDNDGNDHELVASMFKDARVSEYEYHIHSLCSVDSHQMTKERIEQLRKLIVTDLGLYQKILIIHGTDRMVNVAKQLGNIPEKTIVFTGAIIPECVRGSDAVFNLGFAYSCTKLLDQGTYIAMNGHAFNHENVEKLTTNLTFVYTGD